MLVKIITVASVLIVCNGLPPPHPDREESYSNHAVSSQSFTRGDVPLSYEFKAMHPYTITKKSNEESRHTSYPHDLAAYSRENAHQIRQHKPKNAQFLVPEHSHASHFRHNLEKDPVKSLQYAPVQQNVKTQTPLATPNFKPTIENEQQKLVPYRILYMKPEEATSNQNTPSFEHTLINAPATHYKYLNSYHKNILQPENANNMLIKNQISYPQFLQMFRAHQISTNANQQMPHLLQRPHSNVEATEPAENFRHQSDHLPLSLPYGKQSLYQTEFVPMKLENHQHHTDRYQKSAAIQYPAHTQAIFRTNLLQPEAQSSDNVKITYLYPITAPRAPITRS